LVICLVGTFSTHFITQQNIKSTEKINAANIEIAERRNQANLQAAEKQAEANRQAARKLAEAERELKILDIFSDKISSQNDKERETAVRILEAVSQDLAYKISNAILQVEEESNTVKLAAEELKQETLESLKSNNLPTLLSKLTEGDYVVVVASVKTKLEAEQKVQEIMAQYPILYQPKTKYEALWGKGKYESVNGLWAVYVGGTYSSRSAYALRDYLVEELGFPSDSYLTSP